MTSTQGHLGSVRTRARHVVTSPSLPPLEEYTAALSEVWASRQLTNGGAFHERLESELAEYLQVPSVTLFSHGTSALEAAIAVAVPDVSPGDEVITTPYTFVATVDAAISQGLRPRFVDVAPGSPNIDPAAVADAIGPRTRAILPVSCYGISQGLADVEALSRSHGIPMILDAAHAFGARTGERSVTSFGRMAAISLHATKLFHTAEGGAVVAHTDADRDALRRYRNFGYVDEEDIPELGTNAKMSELSAALGVTLLPRMGRELAQRRALARHYAHRLSDFRGLSVLSPVDDPGHNNAYLPVTIGDAASVTRDHLYRELTARGILARRYFFPVVPDFEFVRARGLADADIPHARRVSSTVLCLPLHGGLTHQDVDEILDEVADIVGHGTAG